MSDNDESESNHSESDNESENSESPKLNRIDLKISPEKEIDDDLNRDEEDDEYDEDEDDDDDDSEDDNNIDIDDEVGVKKSKNKKNESKEVDNSLENYVDEHQEDNDTDDDDENDENYLQKFDIDINKNYLVDVHPECLNHNYDEITTLSKVVRDDDNIIIDPFHKTIPFLTKYERARVLGQRAKQINMGAQSFIKIPDNVIDGIIIAELELKQKKIPFIIKRPLPNGACEYWNINDLENILY
jgi:DNA-directed RNA polymerase I, II, and III subunit RPABC2